MLDIFSGLRLVVKRRSISIDNAIFRCHWFFTSTLLVSFSLVITARQYVGQPIECHSVDKISDSLLNSYCWVQGTFSIPQACNQQVGSESPYPCIDNTRGRDIKMFAYYQWVGLVIFIQGLLFHLPYYLWKVWENGLIRAITGGLRVAVLDDQERAKKKEVVVEYIIEHLGCHRRYALKYFLCETICLINLLIQLWATNKFFDGQFLRYGLDVIQYSSSAVYQQSSSSEHDIHQTNAGWSSPASNQSAPSAPRQPAQSTNALLLGPKPTHVDQTHHRPPRPGQPPSAVGLVDPMTYIFPRMTKCTYYDFGSSGDVQKHDALCLLPLNIINEKIYIALWFWFLILALLTLLIIVYRVMAVMCESVRCKGLVSRCKLSSEPHIRIICRHCDVGDWFLLYMIAENVDPLIMREIVAAIADKINAHFELKLRSALLDADQLDADSIHQKGAHLAGADRSSPDEAFGDCSDDQSTLGAGLARSSRRGSHLLPAGAINEANYHYDCHGNARYNNNNNNRHLVSRIGSRLCPRRLRLWSMELGGGGGGDVRRELFGNQPLSAGARSSLGAPFFRGAPAAPDAGSLTMHASAPPAREMPLNAAPTGRAQLLQRQQSSPATARRRQSASAITAAHRTISSSSSSSGVSSIGGGGGGGGGGGSGSGAGTGGGDFVLEMRDMSSAANRRPPADELPLLRPFGQRQPEAPPPPTPRSSRPRLARQWSVQLDGARRHLYRSMSELRRPAGPSARPGRGFYPEDDAGWRAGRR